MQGNVLLPLFKSEQRPEGWQRVGNARAASVSAQRPWALRFPPPAPSPSQLTILSEERAALLELWELRRQQYEQCMDLQLFYRDTEQVDNWMSKQEVIGDGNWLPAPSAAQLARSVRGSPLVRFCVRWRGCQLLWALPARSLLPRLKGPQKRPQFFRGV